MKRRERPYLHRAARLGTALAAAASLVGALSAAQAQQPGPEVLYGGYARDCWVKDQYVDGKWVWLDGQTVRSELVRLDVARKTDKDNPPGFVDDYLGGRYVYIYPKHANSYRWRRVPCTESAVSNNLDHDPGADIDPPEPGRDRPPPPRPQEWIYIGGELFHIGGRLRATERLAATSAVTNEFSDTDNAFGGGFLVGSKFAPWRNNIIVSPFASFDFMNAPVNHTFPGGSFLGTTANFMGTFGVKAGPQVGMGVWLYGIGGVSVLNETLNINFIPVASSQSAWVAGGTLGVGGAWQPRFLQGLGRPVSVFAEYQHTWWQDANFNMPAASPLFNYTFARQDDLVKFGFTIPLSAPPPAAPNYPVKALPPK